MSDIKKLFAKKTAKVLSRTSLETIASGSVESADFVQSSDKIILF